jgi:hypothetical protein
MSGIPGKTKEKRDWRVSAILAAIWFIALAIVSRSGVDIPASMLLVATIFFVLLIPAMNDLVRSMERASGGHSDLVKREPGKGD